MIFLLVPGCARKETAESAELETYHQGSLYLPDKSGAPKKIYVDCHDGESLAPNLEQHLERALGRGKFRLVHSPSEAGYILHVNVLDHGAVAPETLKNAVNAGYGSKTGFNGSGADGLLVDALMVQRRVPEAKRPSRQKMKNISARNALDSSQMRIGILSHEKKHDPEAFSAAIARELAERVVK